MYSGIGTVNLIEKLKILTCNTNFGFENDEYFITTIILTPLY